MGVVSMIFLSVLSVIFLRIAWRRPAGAANAAQRSGTPTLAVLLHDVPLRLYFDYYRVSFHPWQHDNSHLIDEWKAHFGDFGVRVGAS
jgi:predicted metal-dependent hydrolase